MGQKKLISLCVANVHAWHTNTYICSLCTGAQTHSYQIQILHWRGGGQLETPSPTATAQEICEGRKRLNITFAFRQMNTHFYLAKMESPPETKETISSGLLGTYTITICLQSAWVPVCAFTDVATFFFFFFKIKHPTHTLSDSPMGGGMFSAVGTCTCKASV